MVCEATFGRTPWPMPADAAGRSAALREAARAGSPRVCKVLVLAGADANHTTTHGSDGGWTPLCFAAREGHAGAVAVLLAAPGVDPSRANLRMPLAWRRNFRGRVLRPPENGTMPLFIAAQKGHADVATLLLAAPGVDPSRADLHGDTPLHTAVQEGHAGVAALLLANPGVDPSQAKKNGATPLHIAA